jgi:hypothetical protein
MYSEPLDAVPLWLLFVAVCALALLALEGGYRFGRWRHVRAADEKEPPVGAMVGSILGLLAFLLAFTFGLAATRFDARRQVVLEEANAIGTTYLRSKLLPEPQRAETSRLLREYVDARVYAVQEGKLAEGVARSERLHELLWAETIKATENKNGTPVMTSLFVQSLNETIDIHAKRVLIGTRSRIPAVIWVGLFGLALLSMVAVGYQSGLATTSRSPAMVAMVLAFGGVIMLIADLDRGSEGFLTVSQQAMLDLQKGMQAKP